MSIFELNKEGITKLILKNPSFTFFKIFNITNPEADQIQTVLLPLIYPWKKQE